MEQKIRTIVYDSQLQIEACHFYGIHQRFPSHFHTHYVIGYLENGSRRLWCDNHQYTISHGHILLFHPENNHSCVALNAMPFHYWALHIEPKILSYYTQLYSGRTGELVFKQPVIQQRETACIIQALCIAMIENSPQKFALWQSLINKILRYCAQERTVSPPPTARVQRVCSLIQSHYPEKLTLEDFLSAANCKKTSLQQQFSRELGMPPHQYLRNVRLNAAKVLLKQGISPLHTAAMTGFFDQSHFTHSWKETTGFTPGQYQKIFFLSSDQEAYI